MKYLMLVVLLTPFAGFAQKQADYEHAMARFVRYYNHVQGDSIRNMWPANEASSKWMMSTWASDHIKSTQKEEGTILSYKYIGIDTDDPNPGLAVFKTQYSVVGWKTTSFTLENGYLSTFRMITSSPGIDKLLQKKGM